ncbi:MAG: hypothetical protein Q4A92_08065 [Corynebacterium sp.]|nr:hypothetical protein [Corynebacterium sp.]
MSILGEGVTVRDVCGGGAGVSGVSGTGLGKGSAVSGGEASEWKITTIADVLLPAADHGKATAASTTARSASSASVVGHGNADGDCDSE